MPPNDRYRPSVATPQSEGVAAALARQRANLTNSNPLLAGANAFRQYAEPEGMKAQDKFTSQVARALLGSLSQWGGQQMVDSQYNDFARTATDTPLEQLKGESQYTDVYNARRNEQDLLKRANEAAAAKSKADRQKALFGEAIKPDKFTKIVDPNNPNKEVQLRQVFNPETGRWENENIGSRSRETSKIDLDLGNLFKSDIIPASARTRLAQVPGMIESMGTLAQDYDKLGGDTLGDTAAFQFKRVFDTTDEGKLSRKTDLVVKQIQKALEGARPSDFDYKTYTRLINGDKTVSPRETANLIRQAAGLFHQQTQGEINAYQAMEDGGAGYLNQLGAAKDTLSPAGTLKRPTRDQFTRGGVFDEQGYRAAAKNYLGQ